MISYLSGLRQKFSKTNTRVITIIPGYMSTKPFNINSPKQLSEVLFDDLKSHNYVI